LRLQQNCGDTLVQYLSECAQTFKLVLITK
jgi:hypothetical protein